MMLSCLQMKSLPPGVASDFRNAMNFCSMARVSAGELWALATISASACMGWRLVSYCHLAVCDSRSSRPAVCAGAGRHSGASARQVRMAALLIGIAPFAPSQMPGASHGTRKPAVGFGVVFELLRHRIPFQLPSETQGNVLLLHDGLGADRTFNRADGLLPAANSFQKIAAMIVAADHLNLVRPDLLRSERFGFRYDAVAAHENPALGAIDHRGPGGGQRAELGRPLPRRHHVHVDQADSIGVLVLHGVLVRDIADIGVKRGGAFHFHGARVIRVSHPLGNVDIVYAPGAVQAAQSIVADE